MHRKVKVEVDTSKIAQNIRNIKTEYDNYCYYIGVVKGNAYGHGMGIVKTLIESGINYIAVADLDEALEVRSHVPEIPVLCMSPVDLSYLSLCLEQRITMTFSNYDYCQEFLELWPGFSQEAKAQGLKIHIKLNTGFNRLGVCERPLFEEMVLRLTECEGVELEGLFTHLATSGVLDVLHDTQIRQFEELTKNIDLSVIKIIHIARSTTLEFHEKIPFANGIRVGLMMFGINQTFRDYSGSKGMLRKRKDEQLKKKLAISKTKASSALELQAGFVLKAGIMEINKIKAGEIVGYGDGYKVLADAYVAVCPIGYADGLNPNYAGHMVSIKEKLYPLVGTINMCLITVLVDETVSLDDEVVIVGGTIDIKSTARELGVTSYQVMTMIGKDIPRVYL